MATMGPVWVSPKDGLQGKTMYGHSFSPCFSLSIGAPFHRQPNGGTWFWDGTSWGYSNASSCRCKWGAVGLVRASCSLNWIMGMKGSDKTGQFVKGAVANRFSGRRCVSNSQTKWQASSFASGSTGRLVTQIKQRQTGKGCLFCSGDLGFTSISLSKLCFMRQ